MRILYLHQHFASPRSSGGTRTYEFARRLIARGHEVRVVTGPAYLAEEFQPRRLADERDIEGVPAVVLRVPYANQMGVAERLRSFAQFAALSTAEALKWRPDVVLAVSTPLTIAIPAIAARLRHRVPMVFEVGDLWPELPIAMGMLKNPAAVQVARAMEWAAYHSSASVIALSPGMAEGVIRRGMPPERVATIPNGCDIDRFLVPEELGEPVRMRLGLRPEQPLIVYTGTFGRINGVSYMVETAAVARAVAPDLRFLLVGGGHEYDLVRQRAQALGVLDENLFLWPSLPKTEMPAVLAAATVCSSMFIPLREMWHNSSNKFFDALAAGRPVAVNYGGWQAEMIAETGMGLVLPHDSPAQAARLLGAFCADEERLTLARAASRRVARERFSREAQAEQFIALIERAAGSRAQVAVNV